MGWLDILTAGLGGLSGYFNGAINTLTDVLNGLADTNNNNSNYIDDKDEADSETDTTTQQYVTYIVYGEPLRKTKFIFVPEMLDFCSDEELNTAYHSKSEYSDAVSKYGYIYKAQKFENADTVEKLLDYSIDWIKNNYHGGITSFSITALDMHLAGVTELDKYTTGSRVNVQYTDPATSKETSQCLTIISSEYDLSNPEKNQYKIGIPDVSLNKVYGETSKNGGGGGGGKTSDEEDNDTNTELDALGSAEEALQNIIDQNFWAHMINNISTSDDTVPILDLLTPKEKNPTSSWSFGMAADALKATVINGSKAVISKITSKYVDVNGGVNAKQITSDVADLTKAVISEKTKTKDLDVEDKADAKNLSVTDTASVKTLKINGTSFSASASGGKVKLVIGGTTYTITPDSD